MIYLSSFFKSLSWLLAVALGSVYWPQAIAKNAERIIALSPHAVEMLYAIGAGDKIVATLEYADYPAAAKNIPRIGNYVGVQIERVIELQPDLVVGWKGGNQLADLEKIASLGFNLIYSNPSNLNEVAVDLKRLGDQTGMQAEARAAIAQLQTRHQSIINKYENKPLVKVFYQLWHDPLRSIGPGTWIESLINDCNGTNLMVDSDTGYPLISLETVLSKNPQVIIIPHHSGSDIDKKEIWQSWKMIDAVKNENIFTLNGDLLHRPTPRSVDGLSTLCEAIDRAR